MRRAVAIPLISAITAAPVFARQGDLARRPFNSAPLQCNEDIMAKLTTQTRKKLPTSDFALSGGRYPVADKAHARDAKARASQQHNAGNLSASDKAKVDRRANAVLGKRKG